MSFAWPGGAAKAVAAAVDAVAQLAASAATTSVVLGTAGCWTGSFADRWPGSAGVVAIAAGNGTVSAAGQWTVSAGVLAIAAGKWSALIRAKHGTIY